MHIHRNHQMTEFMAKYMIFKAKLVIFTVALAINVNLLFRFHHKLRNI